MSQVNTTMNFLPEDYVEKRQATRTAIVFIGLLLVVVGGIVGAYLYSQWNMRGIFQERDRVNTAFEDASKKIAEAEELGQQKERMIAKVETITTLMERVRRSILLGELTRLRPDGVNFVSVDLKTKDSDSKIPVAAGAKGPDGQPLAARPPAADVMLTVTGTAPTDADVASYLTALQKSPILTNVTLIFSEEFKKDKDDPAIRRFSVELHVNPDVDLRGGGPVVSASPSH